MPQQTNAAAEPQSLAVQPDIRPWIRREPGLAVLLLGLVVMILALVLPMQHRAFAFYPGLVSVGIGMVLTLAHGPEPRPPGE
ncbi:MAG: hypothetical protein ABI026_04130 [Gemmatimonadaceae bacterium]